MKKRLSQLLVLVTISMALASCRSSKNVTQENINAESVQQQQVESLPRAAGLTAQQNLCAKVKASVSLNGKSVSTGGNLRMRMGDVIQISLHDPLLGITEIGRLEISPDNILLIDRYNKQYVQMTYDEINALIAEKSQGSTPKTLTYDEIEYHFWQQALRTDTDELQYQIPTGGKDIKLRFRLSGKNESDDWETHTTPSGRYEQVSSEQLLKGLTQ
mgnify:CR=1 FL=1